MQRLAAFIMRGRVYAMLVAAVFGVISLLLPPLQPITTTLSSGVVALVVLRLGAREGIYIMLGAMAGVVMVALPLFGSPAPAVVLAAIVWLPVLILALVLRQTISLALTLQVAVLLGSAVVVGIHGLLPDPAAWWRDMLANMIQQSQLDKTGPDQMGAQMGQVMQRVAPYMTGVVASALMLSAMLGMVIGRWWQSLLYNPGGFGEEFRALQLGSRVAYPGVVVLAASLFGQFSLGGSLAAIATDLLVVLVIVYALQGLAVAHAISIAVKRSAVWLMIVYALLAILPPFVVVALAGIGFADNWMNFRAYFGAKKPDVPREP